MKQDVLATTLFRFNIVLKAVFILRSLVQILLVILKRAQMTYASNARGRFDQPKLRIPQIACIATTRALILFASSFSPHLVSPVIAATTRNHKSLISLNSFPDKQPTKLVDRLRLFVPLRVGGTGRTPPFSWESTV